MLVGDGMKSTIITGSKSFADGFSTFATASLTVIGDKFLARDLTIANTAGSKKFQAVAARVTSNSAFYHCNFSSVIVLKELFVLKMCKVTRKRTYTSGEGCRESPDEHHTPCFTH
ncbi:hypothetical protein TB2_017750 [Malus domestica]